jgi:hypothetical protein
MNEKATGSSDRKKVRAVRPHPICLQSQADLFAKSQLKTMRGFG